ncbi:hypothetical protein ACFL5N_02055, partial [bacterium]
MAKRFFTFFLLVSLFFQNYSYSGFDDWSSSRRDNYGYSQNWNQSNYNTYNPQNILDLTPSNYSQLTINARENFLKNPIFSSLRTMWVKNDAFSENLQKYVAPDLSVTNYATIKITENTKWESYSNLTQKYNIQNFQNVKLDTENKIQSFDLFTSRDAWTMRENVKDISYNKLNLPTSLTLVTQDITGNEFTQRISDIKYGQSTDFNRYQNILDLCDKRIGREGYYNFQMLKSELSQFPKPPRQLPKSFKLETLDNLGNKTLINFANIGWEKDRVMNFESEIFRAKLPNVNINAEAMFKENGEFSGIDVTVKKEGEVNNFTLNNQDLSAKDFLNLMDLGVNPLKLMGSSIIPLGETKIAFLSQSYNEDGMLNQDEKYELNYEIDNKLEIRNLLKNDLYDLEQTAPMLVKNRVWDKNVENMSEQDLRQINNEITTRIEGLIPEYKNQTEIKTNWGDKLDARNVFDLKLEDNRLKSDSAFKTEDGSKVREVGFVINDKLELEAVQGIKETFENGIEKIEEKGLDYFKAPEIKKIEEPVATSEIILEEMTNNKKQGLGYRTNEEISEHKKYEIEIGKRIGESGDIVFCFKDDMKSRVKKAMDVTDFGREKGDMLKIGKWKNLLVEAYTLKQVENKKEMTPVAVDVLEKGLMQKEEKNISLEEMGNKYKDIKIVRPREGEKIVSALKNLEKEKKGNILENKINVMKLYEKRKEYGREVVEIYKEKMSQKYGGESLQKYEKIKEKIGDKIENYEEKVKSKYTEIENKVTDKY